MPFQAIDTESRQVDLDVVVTAVVGGNPTMELRARDFDTGNSRNTYRLASDEDVDDFFYEVLERYLDFRQLRTSQQQPPV